jgi:hypothetical protein
MRLTTYRLLGEVFTPFATPFLVLPRRRRNASNSTYLPTEQSTC